MAPFGQGDVVLMKEFKCRMMWVKQDEEDGAFNIIFESIETATCSQYALRDFLQSIVRSTVGVGPVHGDFDVTIREV